MEKLREETLIICKEKYFIDEQPRKFKKSVQK